MDPVSLGSVGYGASRTSTAADGSGEDVAFTLHTLGNCVQVLNTQRELDPIPGYRDPRSRVGGWEDEGSCGETRARFKD